MKLLLTVLVACSGLALGQQGNLPTQGQGSAPQQKDPCKEEDGVVADATYCDRYWQCFNGQPELFDCPNGLVFLGKNRGIADGCDYPWRVEHVCYGKQMANPAISNADCPWMYGIFGHRTSCTRYLTCWNGTSTEQFCIGGLLYNQDTHACDWPQNVVGCQKHPICAEDPNGNVRLGTSCERYWSCMGGYPRLQRCSATLVFDRISKKCVTGPTEDCEAVVLPQRNHTATTRFVNPNHRARKPRPQQAQKPQPKSQSRPSQQNRPSPQARSPIRPSSLSRPAQRDQQPQEQRFQPVEQLEPLPEDLFYEEDSTFVADEAFPEEETFVTEEPIRSPEPVRPSLIRRPQVDELPAADAPAPNPSSRFSAGRRSRRPPIAGAVRIN